jgi:hypothetical protein
VLFFFFGAKSDSKGKGEKKIQAFEDFLFLISLSQPISTKY